MCDLCGDLKSGRPWWPAAFQIRSEDLLLGISDFFDMIIHQMPAEAAIKHPLYCRELLMMLPEKIIRTIIDAKILANCLALDIGVVAVKINHRIAKILYGYTISAKRTCASRV